MFKTLDRMSSGFETEAEIAAKKKARQEEWDRVRKPEDPETAPEPEPQDNRSLFDRLEEQRVAKQDEWDEAHKLKNQIRGIDDDEADFLDTVDNIRAAAESQRRREDAQALKGWTVQSNQKSSVYYYFRLFFLTF